MLCLLRDGVSFVIYCVLFCPQHADVTWLKEDFL